MVFKLAVHKRFTMAAEISRFDTWLVMDGTVVAYLDLLDRPEYNGLLCACAVQTRDGYERQGLSKKIMEMAAIEFGKPLGCSGGFTPEGFAAYSGKLPLIPGATASDKPTYRSMKFVKDWENVWIDD